MREGVGKRASNDEVEAGGEGENAVSTRWSCKRTEDEADVGDADVLDVEDVGDDSANSEERGRKGVPKELYGNREIGSRMGSGEEDTKTGCEHEKKEKKIEA